MAEVESAMVGARPIVGVGHSRCNQSRGGTGQILLPSRHRRSRRRLRNWGTCLSNQDWMVESVMADVCLGLRTVGAMGVCHSRCNHYHRRIDYTPHQPHRRHNPCQKRVGKIRDTIPARAAGDGVAMVVTAVAVAGWVGWVDSAVREVQQGVRGRARAQ